MVSFRKPLQPYMTLFEDCIVQTIANNVSYINQTKNLNTSSSENQKKYYKFAETKILFLLIFQLDVWYLIL